MIMTATEHRTISVQMNITFRFAERDDLPKLEWYGEYLHFRRVFQRTYEDQLEGSRLMLLAVTNDWPVGQIFMQLASYHDIFADMRRHGYFYSLRVMDAFRGMGLGTMLLREAENVLIDRRHDSVSIAAAKANPGARRLYERQGFRVQTEDAGRWHYVDHEGRTQYVVEPCWILEKQLTRPDRG
jgi:ribosomal protein S18 acetylase RimI-like enzyme